MSKITLIPYVDPENPVESARQYNHTGADAVAYCEKKASLEKIKEIKEVIDVPLYAGGGIRDLEDVKKVLYAGADKVCLGAAVLEDKDIVKKSIRPFWKGSGNGFHGSGRAGRSRSLCQGNEKIRSGRAASFGVKWV